MHLIMTAVQLGNQNFGQIRYSRDYKTPLYLFLRLFGASSIQVGLLFEWVLYLTI